MEYESYQNTHPVNIQIRLKKLEKTQQYLSTLFNRSPAQISNAINTQLYPTLKSKIINHIDKLEARQEAK